MPEVDLDGSGDVSKQELTDAVRLHERRQLERVEASASATGTGLQIGLSVLFATLLAMVPCASPDPLSRKLRRGYRNYREASRARVQQRAWRAELELAEEVRRVLHLACAAARLRQAHCQTARLTCTRARWRR